MLMRRDAGAGKICFVDVAASDYSPDDNAGISFEEVSSSCCIFCASCKLSADKSPPYQSHNPILLLQAMGSIHAILPDGSVIKEVEVFRRLYEAVGLGWIYAITKYEPVEKVANL